METAMEIVPTLSEPLDLETIRSRARELENMLVNLDEVESESEKFVGDCALSFKRRIEEMVSEWSGVSFLDDKEFEACIERLNGELNAVEAENGKISQDIEALSRTQAEGFSRLEIELESLKCSLEFPVLQDTAKVQADVSDDYTRDGNDKSSSLITSGGDNLQILDLENQMQKKSLILKSLKDLDCVFKWFDATEQIEDSFTGVKVIAIDGNCIRLSLQTYIPITDSLLSQNKLVAVNVPLEVKHELLIEISEGTMNLKNVEIFPNDVSINNVLKAAKDFSKSSLQWLVTKVQDRIVLCTMRQIVVKSANKSGYSFEYLDKDEIMVAYLAGGVNAVIKVSQGWPISNFPLMLTSIKSSDHYKKEFSSSLFSKIKEAANSLAAHIRSNMSSFVDNIEKILEQKQLELMSK